MSQVLRAALLVMATALPLAAQTLAERVAAVGTGTVRFEFPAREGVCGNGRGGISVRRDDGRTTVQNMSVNSSRRNEWEDDCEPGPVRIALDVESRRVTGVRSYVGGRWRGSADRDLGAVSASEASAFLLNVAATAAEKPAKDAIFPATLAADVPDPWRALLSIAKDEDRPREVRQSALFWVSQAASDAATEGLQELVEDDDSRVRESAVFALSQRPADESVPALIRLARTHRDSRVRRNAVFWLGQSKDARALSYFEEVLLRADRPE
jgi:hypothetical protein